MLRHLSRGRALSAAAGAFLLLMSSASAGHGTCGISQDTYVKDAYPDVTLSMTFGSHRPSAMEIDVPAGYDLAQQTGTSPISPVPSDEEVIGSGVMQARWAPFCLSASMSLTLTWESSIPASAPSGTVALWQLAGGGGLFWSDIFVVREGPSDYRIVIPQMPSTSMCASTTDGSFTLTIQGTTASGAKVIQNPPSAGTYTWTLAYADTSGAAHACSVAIPITN